MHHHENNCSHSESSPSLSQTIDEVKFDSSIHSACVYGDFNKIKKLIDKKPDCVNEPDKYGFTPLHYSSRSGNYDICKYLLANNASVNSITNSCKSTALHRAAYMSHEPIVELLIKYNANLLAQDSDGKTPLHKCIENKAKNYEKVAQLLIEKNKKQLEIKDSNGKLPQDY